ncbi:hypothetical protein BV25DRAFT_1819089 [Artomyces pyxidatus]|uniref:Uncharacterized protein n=1 Tax=Artomyces pyxidatus TaxID=48021 RepID=A0ACB8TH19_9AGAM|nr:hypothetical protein BV25DRAFT_1819089 [Artomyces pyxidatus]
MPLLIPAIISNASRPNHSFVVLESSIAQSCLPLLRAIIKQQDANKRVLLFNFLYPPSYLVDEPAREGLQIVEGRIPGYSDDWTDPHELILNAVNQAPEGPLNVIIDSADTLCTDLNSPSKAYALVASVLALVRSRPSSRLILHILSPSPLLPLLLLPRLSSNLTHLIAHPPVLLTHLTTAHLTPPPPLTPPARFFRVFSPLTARAWEVEHLVFGSGGDGAGGDDAVVEVLVRVPPAGEKRRGVERVLEGWAAARGACALGELESLKKLWVRKVVDEAAPDPTQNLSFNLNLTPEQQQARAQVPLPYVHEGKTPGVPPTSTAAIFYDPDSADDIDDDDPDEDLDI